MNEPTFTERRLVAARQRVQQLQEQLRKANEELTDATDEWVAEWIKRTKGDA